MSNLTLNEFTTQMSQLLHSLENNEDLRAPLQTIGYNMDEITNGRSLLTTLQNTIQQREQEYNQQLAATDAIQQAQEELQATYQAHRTIARISLKDNQTAYDQLQLDGRYPQARIDLLSHARNFYQTLNENPEYITAISNQFSTFTPETITNTLATLTQTETLWATQQEEINQAEQATQNRNQAWQEARVWYNSFRQVANLVYANQPQLKQTLFRKIPS